jgi:hypothetical protein
MYFCEGMGHLVLNCSCNTRRLVSNVKNFAPEFQLKYNKHYIGLAQNGKAMNFTVFKPRRNTIIAEIKLAASSAIQERLKEAEIDLLEYDNRYGAYRLRLTAQDIEKHAALIEDLLRSSFKEFA